MGRAHWRATPSRPSARCARATRSSPRSRRPAFAPRTRRCWPTRSSLRDRLEEAADAVADALALAQADDLDHAGHRALRVRAQIAALRGDFARRGCRGSREVGRARSSGPTTSSSTPTRSSRSLGLRDGGCRSASAVEAAQAALDLYERKGHLVGAAAMRAMLDALCRSRRRVTESPCRWTPPHGVATKSERSSTVDAVYLQTNDAEKNEVVAFRRSADGTLSTLGTYATGGRGTGKPHLASQGSIVAAGDRLLVVNAGSDDVSLFAVTPDGLGAARPRRLGWDDADEHRGSRLAGVRAERRRRRERDRLRARGRQPRAERRHARAARRGSRADRLYAGRLGAGRHRSRDRLAARAAGSRRRARPTRVLGRHALRLRLHERRHARRDRGIRRHRRRRGRVVVRNRARAGEQERREHAQRGLLGRRDEGRPLRLRDELRRRHDLELLDRRRRLARARRGSRRLDHPRREGRARRGAVRRRALPLRARRRRAQSLRVRGAGRRQARPGRRRDGLPATAAGLAAV